jgi:hypothetical protein
MFLFSKLFFRNGKDSREFRPITTGTQEENFSSHDRKPFSWQKFIYQLVRHTSVIMIGEEMINEVDESTSNFEEPIIIFSNTVQLTAYTDKC